MSYKTEGHYFIGHPELRTITFGLLHGLPTISILDARGRLNYNNINTALYESIKGFVFKYYGCDCCLMAQYVYTQLAHHEPVRVLES